MEFICFAQFAFTALCHFYVLRVTDFFALRGFQRRFRAICALWFPPNPEHVECSRLGRISGKAEEWAHPLGNVAWNLGARSRTAPTPTMHDPAISLGFFARTLAVAPSRTSVATHLRRLRDAMERNRHGSGFASRCSREVGAQDSVIRIRWAKLARFSLNFFVVLVAGVYPCS